MTASQIVCTYRQLCGAAAETLEGPAWASVLPLAYLGRRDDEAAVQAVWEEVRWGRIYVCMYMYVWRYT